MPQAIEIQNMLILEYLRDAGEYPNYNSKYINAQLILRNQPETMAKLELLLKKRIEQRWGCSLSYLQTALNSSRNLKCYIRPKVHGRRIKITLGDIKVVLDGFKFEMDKIIIAAASEGEVKW